MTNQELYKQAILDARAVRETAMAAAKDSLAEAFEPRIKEMLRMKLSEDFNEEGDTENLDIQSETMGMKDPANMEEATLDEILAELDALSEDMKGDKMEEAKGKKGDEEKIEEAEEKEEEGDEATDDDEDGMPTGMEGEPEDDQKVVSITVGDLKDIFRDVFAQLQGGGASEVPAPAASGEGDDEMMAELSLEEILAELEEEDNRMDEMAYNPGDVKKVASGDVGRTAELEEKKKMEKELEEAKKAITVMRTELQEINLLNAKLLYVNKLWKGKSLTESQKVKVLNAFDRAASVKEAENIYKTLSESLVLPKKTDLKESMGFASKPIGAAPSKPIIESDSMVIRWQTLAGIK